MTEELIDIIKEYEINDELVDMLKDALIYYKKYGDFTDYNIHTYVERGIDTISIGCRVEPAHNSKLDILVVNIDLQERLFQKSFSINGLKQLLLNLENPNPMQFKKSFYDTSFEFEPEKNVIQGTLSPVYKSIVDVEKMKKKQKERQRREQLEKMKPLMEQEMRSPLFKKYRRGVYPISNLNIHEEEPELSLHDVEVYERIRPVMAKVDEIEAINLFRKKLMTLLQNNALSNSLLGQYQEMYGEIFDPYHPEDRNKHIYQMTELMYKNAISEGDLSPSKFSKNLLD